MKIKKRIYIDKTLVWFYVILKTFDGLVKVYVYTIGEKKTKLVLWKFRIKIRFERSWLGQHNQGKNSSTPVTSDLSKTFHQICHWLHQLVKTKKSTEDCVIYLLGNLQCDVSDWLTLINKLDTIATYSIPMATCQLQLTTPNHACPCVCACRPEVPPYRTKKRKKKKGEKRKEEEKKYKKNIFY